MSNVINPQTAEFDALNELTRHWGRLRTMSIVSDSYSAARHDYESALRDFVEAYNENRTRRLMMVAFAQNNPVAPHEVMTHVSTVNLKRAERWHQGGIDTWGLSDWGIALAGETGELAEVVLALAVCQHTGALGNAIKKINRQTHRIQQKAVLDLEALHKQFRMEIGDVYLYLDLLAQRHGVALADCVRDTFNRVSEREGFPERL